MSSPVSALGSRGEEALEPIGPHAAEQQERDEREGLGGEHQPEVARAASPLDDEQGEATSTMLSPITLADWASHRKR